jgi:ADP-heptose:LPS heptosyltransferase
VPRRVGFAVPECRPFLSTALPWHPDDHVTVQGLALVEAVWATKDEGRRTKASAQALSPDSKTSFPNLRGSAFHLRSHLPARRTEDEGRRAEDEQTPADGQRPGTNGASFSTLNAQQPIPRARFDPEPKDLTWADDWLAGHLAGGGKLVVIHPGTGGPAKLWTAERWAAVADALAARGDIRLLLTGGPGEEALVAAVRAGMRAPAPSLAGQTSLGQLAALLRRADLVLGVDSGPLHLAAAQGTPTVHLYGPGDERRFGPWGDPARHAVLRTALWCSPCGVFGACPRGLARPECMERIGTAAVLEAARAALDT